MHKNYENYDTQRWCANSAKSNNNTQVTLLIIIFIIITSTDSA